MDQFQPLEAVDEDWMLAATKQIMDETGKVMTVSIERGMGVILKSEAADLDGEV